MAAETNVIKKVDMAKVRELDFALKFGENIDSLVKMLGITRKIPVTAGTALKVLKTTGTLQSGTVAEGDIIPLSHYETTWETVAEATLKKWRKAATAEAILKGGYDQAQIQTSKKMILDIQKGIRTAFVNMLGTGQGSATGADLQEALADAWGKLQVAFEDDAIETVFFVNPEDVAKYLGAAQITTQTSFGFRYLEDFLGLGKVILTPQITKGTFYATAAENIVLYYINATAAGLNEAFSFTTDAKTGLVGVHELGNYERMQAELIAVSGVTLFAEKLGGVIVGTVNSGN